MTVKKWKHSGTKKHSMSDREIRNGLLSEKAAEEGIVLLKNDKKILPLNISTKIGLYGAGAGKTVKGGTGSGDVNNRSNISIYQGLKENGIQIVSEKWLANYESIYAEARRAWKEKILEEALKLFAQSGYMGTSMNEIASRLGVTKAALYKHYSSKQEILDSIVERMNQMDVKRAKEYEMPDGDMEDVIAGYKNIALEKIRQFTKVQFLHWTEEEFSCCFRKMLTLEQYRDPKMAKLYQNYLAEGPLRYMEAVFSGIVESGEDAKQLAMDFYGPIFLLYSIYDGAENKQEVVKQVEEHVEKFAKRFQKMLV